MDWKIGSIKRWRGGTREWKSNPHLGPRWNNRDQISFPVRNNNNRKIDKIYKMALEVSDIRKQKTLIPMRQERKDPSPSAGFPNCSPRRGTSHTPEDALSWGDGAESGDTHVARVHRTDHQKREGTVKVYKGPSSTLSWVLIITWMCRNYPKGQK